MQLDASHHTQRDRSRTTKLPYNGATNSVPAGGWWNAVVVVVSVVVVVVSVVAVVVVLGAEAYKTKQKLLSRINRNQTPKHTKQSNNQSVSIFVSRKWTCIIANITLVILAKQRLECHITDVAGALYTWSDFNNSFTFALSSDNLRKR